MLRCFFVERFDLFYQLSLDFLVEQCVLSAINFSLFQLLQNHCLFLSIFQTYQIIGFPTSIQTQIMFCFIFRAVAGLNGFEFQDRLLKVDFANNRPPFINNRRMGGRPNGQNNQQNRPEFPLRYKFVKKKKNIFHKLVWYS